MPQKKRTTPNKPIEEEKPIENEAAADNPVDSEPSQSVYAADEIQETEKDVDITEFAERMDLNIVCCGDNETLHFSTFNISRPGLQLAGYYKHFAPERVQIMGQMEMTYLQQMTHDARKTACETLMKHPIPCLIVTAILPPCDELIAAAQKYNRVLLTSKVRTTPFVNKLSLYLSELLAPSVTIHGVLMDLYGVGVLLIGESGIGKSETALSLVERGHRLVADDAVTISRIGDRLDGTCPDMIRYFMELRGIGIIDIKAMYGASAVQLVKRIDMVIKLEAWDDKMRYTRLGAPDESYTILGVKKPLHIVPVKPGRNLAIILEAAARTHRLNDLGFNAMDELNERLRGNSKK
ncbi:MAG: HPr(Ser) kinase/phosphatase [Clostridiales bacterium]|nr:HPr(Ser) kinase/phosphatase [Clostridiales bacterium]